MPAYNAAPFLAESIHSVQAQTFADWELMIVDDGSTDETAMTAKQYCTQDSRILYCYQTNGKQGKARNTGIANTTGDLLAFLDADDVWLPEKLALQLEQMTQYSVDMVFADAFMFGDASTDRQHLMGAYKGLLQHRSGVQLMLDINRVPVLTALVKRSAVAGVGGFSENASVQNAEDYHLWLKLLMHGCKLYGADAILAGYRVHNNASTSSDKLASGAVLETFCDLQSRFPEYKYMLHEALGQRLRTMHYKVANPSSAQYHSLITKTCKYMHCQWLQPVAALFYKVFGLRVARKLLMILM